MANDEKDEGGRVEARPMLVGKGIGTTPELIDALREARERQERVQNKGARGDFAKRLQAKRVAASTPDAGDEEHDEQNEKQGKQKPASALRRFGRGPIIRG